MTECHLRVLFPGCSFEGLKDWSCVCPQRKSPGRIRYRGEFVTDGRCLDKRSEIVTRQRTHLARFLKLINLNLEVQDT